MTMMRMTSSRFEDIQFCIHHVVVVKIRSGSITDPSKQYIQHVHAASIRKLHFTIAHHIRAAHANIQ
jgi:hypothetical protein